MYLITHPHTVGKRGNKTLLHSMIEDFVVNKIGQNKNKNSSWRYRRIAWCRSRNSQKDKLGPDTKPAKRPSEARRINASEVSSCLQPDSPLNHESHALVSCGLCRLFCQESSQDSGSNRVSLLKKRESQLLIHTYF